MYSMNHVFLMGNLTRDPELRRLPSGTAVGDVGLAVSESYKDKEGKAAERTDFFDIVIWGRQAETCAEYLKKGAPVMVEGKLQLDQWQTEQGEKRSRTRVRAQRVHFLPRAGNEQKAQPAANASHAPAPAANELEVEVPF